MTNPETESGVGAADFKFPQKPKEEGRVHTQRETEATPDPDFESNETSLRGGERK